MDRNTKTKKLETDRCCFESHLLKLSESHYIWYLNQHHLITDVWSSSLIYKSVVITYHQLQQQLEPASSSLSPIEEYFQFEQNNRNNRLKSAQASNQQLDPQNINFYGAEFHQDTGQTKRLTHSLTESDNQLIKSLANQKSVVTISQHLTLFNIYLTALCAYLHRVTNLSTITIGIPIHNRSQFEHQKTIGLFVELFPLTVEVNNGATFLELYTTVSIETQTLLQTAGPGLSNNESAKRFSVVLNYIPVDFDDKVSFADAIDWVHCDYCDPAHFFRLHVYRFKADQTPQLAIDINQRLWQSTKQPDITGHFYRVLSSFIKEPTRKVSRVNLSSNQDKDFLLSKYNKPFTDVPHPSTTVLDLFKQSVNHYPGRTAIFDGDKSISFSELDLLSDQLCLQLQEHDVDSGDLVGLYLQRSIELIVAILAVHKAAAGYVPLEPNIPKLRLNFITKQSGLKIVLTQAALQPRLNELSVNSKLIKLDDLSDPASNTQVNLITRNKSDTAYVMYTSGSTGEPKGVIISHNALHAYISWAIEHYTDNQANCFAFYSSIGFDLTVTSIFVPLCSGSSLRIYRSNNQLSDLSILDVIEDNQVDIVKLTPAHLELIDTDNLNNSHIKTFIVGGEDFKVDLAKRIYKRFNGKINLINEYGPTEATVGCMIHQYDPDVDRDYSVSIGIPAEHSRIYLLDEGLNPVPQGITGEIYIAGINLAQGYLNQPTLSDESFIEDPFYTGERMYKTGDLAQWQNGKLVYLGRKDDQYKIRGIRIEKAEVEHAINSHPKIKSSYLRLVKPKSVKTNEISNCQRCGIASNYPDLRFDSSGICNLCRDYELYYDKAEQYFSDLAALEKLLTNNAKRKTDRYDCLMLLSGGKDSTYALYQLSKMGFSIYAMTLDNGFISASAKTNIQRTVDELSIDHEFTTTEFMNDIFVESLKQHCSVCYGCFKTIYTLALKIAKEKGIPSIVTGLSRGQFFETRLTKTSFDSHRFDPDQIDNEVLNTRKVYHRVKDTVTTKLAGGLVDDDRIFEEIRFVDFYRYCDVSLTEIYEFLQHEVPWVRPQDTDRSTNCLINDTGIYYHKQVEGYHNYALPYSWDVRLGLKTREQAIDELDDVIDIRNVHENLEKIGFTDYQKLSDSKSQRLVAYYIAEQQVDAKELREFLTDHLNRSVIPNYLVQLDKLPLTINGKVDHKKLPEPNTQAREHNQPLIEASTAHEKTLARIFSQVLQQAKISVEDNYFDLGGDSIKAIQIAAQASQFGMRIKPSQLFDHQTIQELADYISNTNTIKIDQTAVQGSAPLTPIQRWFFKQPHSALNIYNHSIHLELNRNISTANLQTVFTKLIAHHDALHHRYPYVQHNALHHRYPQELSYSKQQVDEYFDSSEIIHCSVKEEVSDEALSRIEQELHESIDIHEGRLISVAVIRTVDDTKNKVLIVIHHLAVDAVSWQIFLEDLDLLCKQIHQGEELLLPLKTTVFLNWAKFFEEYNNSKTHLNTLAQLPDRKNYHPVFVKPSTLPTTTKKISTYVFEVSLSIYQPLLNLTVNEQRVPIHKILLAGLARCLSHYGNQQSICINVESHGRYELDDQIDITRTLGWFTSINPICLDIKLESVRSSFETLIEQINQQIDISFHRFIESECSQNKSAHRQSNVLFNYFGEHLDAQYQEFTVKKTLSFVRSEQAELQHALELNLFDCDQTLRIECSYDPSYIDQSRLILLMDEYKTEMQLFADNLSPTTGKFADFGIDSFSDQDLAAIKKQLR